MYEFHGWFGLAETPTEADAGGLPEIIDEIKALVGWFVPPQAVAEVRGLNGEYFLWINGMVNRRRDEGTYPSDNGDLSYSNGTGQM